MRSDLYQTLAEILAEPPDWLAYAGHKWPLYQAALALSTHSPAARQAVEALEEIEAEALENRQTRYQQLLAGPGSNSIALYESGFLHKMLLTAETFDVENWYHQAGLKISDGEMPDHASLELAFLAYLSGQAYVETTKIEAAFLQQHAARWLPSLGRRIAASADPVYAPVGRLLANWIEEVCSELGVPGFHYAQKNRPTHSPARIAMMKDADACTLCSFCVNVCRKGALTIRENDLSTDLVLTVERCIGCGKCERICPERAISLGAVLPAGQSSSEKDVLLKHSDRAACKACGIPLVSQAELAYIANCLGSQEWLHYCPDCRNFVPDDGLFPRV